MMPTVVTPLIAVYPLLIRSVSFAVCTDLAQPLSAYGTRSEMALIKLFPGVIACAKLVKTATEELSTMQHMHTQPLINGLLKTVTSLSEKVNKQRDHLARLIVAYKGQSALAPEGSMHCSFCHTTEAKHVCAAAGDASARIQDCPICMGLLADMRIIDAMQGKGDLARLLDGILNMHLVEDAPPQPFTIPPFPLSFCPPAFIPKETLSRVLVAAKCAFDSSQAARGEPTDQSAALSAASLGKWQELLLVMLAIGRESANQTVECLCVQLDTRYLLFKQQAVRMRAMSGQGE
jgi:hypothetical protein